MGRSEVLLLGGDPGIGKTALLTHARERAREKGLQVLSAQGYENESDLAFGALAELARPVLELLEAVPAPQRRALEAALAIGPPVDTDRFAISAGALSLLGEASSRGPLLITLDDAQWVDGPSAEVLAFVARRLTAEGIAILVASRRPADELTSWIRRVRIEGLSAAEAQDFLRERTGTRIPPGVAERLSEATGGNPLALAEMAEVLSADELAGRTMLPEPLPTGEGAQRSFLRRIRSLPADTRTALAFAAASYTRGFGPIEAALRSEGLSATALEPAERHGLIAIGDGRISWSHPLVRSAAFHAVDPAVRRTAHGALASAAQDPDLRAWHLAEAATGPDEEVASLLDDTAERARDRGGLSSASAAYERAARLTADRTLRTRRFLTAAHHAVAIGAQARAEQLLSELGRPVDDPLLEADAALLRGRNEAALGLPLRAHDELLSGAEAVATEDPARAAVMLNEAAIARMSTGDPQSHLELVRRALAASEGTGTLHDLVRLHLAVALTGVGERATALEMIRDNRAILEDDLHSNTVPDLIGMGIHCLTWTENFDEARSLLDQMIARGRSADAVRSLLFSLSAHAILDLRTGHSADALADATESVELAETTAWGAPLCWSVSVLATVEAQLGEDSALETAQRAEQLALRLGSGALRPYAQAARAHFELSAGHTAEAATVLREMHSGHAARGLKEPSVYFALPDLVEASARSGDDETAREALARLEAEARATGGRWARAASLRCRGLLAEDDVAEEAFREALAAHEALPMPFELARTQLCFGEALRRDRRRSDAREPLRAALAEFERQGSVLWADRARAELQATGETVRRRDPSARDSLTGQEYQVARVVAGGVTNREAAATLFLSPKTIEFHLGNVYRKLGIRSRAELVKLFAEGEPPGLRPGGRD